MLHLLVGVSMEGECQTCERKEGNQCLGFIWAESPQRGDTGKMSIFFGAEDSQVAPEVKNPPADAEDVRDTGSIPGSERSPGEEHGNPLQYSCLESLMDRGAWWAMVHGVAKGRT